MRALAASCPSPLLYVLRRHPERSEGSLYSAVVIITSSSHAVGGAGCDAAGNVTFDGLNQIAYDGEGRVCAISNNVMGNGVTQYLYDAEGRRVAKGHSASNPTLLSCSTGATDFVPTQTYILGQSGEQVTELNGSGKWQHTNVYAAGTLLATYDNQGTGLHFHVADPLGSRRVQVSSAGMVELNISNLPYGDAQVINGSGTDATEHHFTGKEREAESGLDYFGARYYGSNMGRFISPDWEAKPEAVPYSSLDNSQSLNLYAYVGNNPMSQIDQDGHAKQDAQGQVVTNGLGVSFCVGGPCPNQNSPATQTSAQQQKTMDKVAMGAEAAAIGPTRTSVANKNPHEYGGLILQRDKDGKISATGAITGAERQVDVDSIKVPNGYTVVGEYHTHPHATATEGEGPSPGDIYRLRYPSMQGRIGYVVDTVSGNVYRYNGCEPVQGPYDTHSGYGTKIGTIP